MDPVVIGVIGSLAGVVIGAGAQQLQAARTHKWHILETERQGRRELYVRFLTALYQFVPTLVNASTNAQLGDTQQTEKLNEVQQGFDKLYMLTSEVALVANPAIDALVGDLYEPVDFLAAAAKEPKVAAEQKEQKEEITKMLDRVVDLHDRILGAMRDDLNISLKR
jgi:hypothetical protein